MTARILVMTRTQPGPSEETKPTGTVAEAAVFSDGTAVLHWLTKPGSTEVYGSEKDLRKIREFSGRSHFAEVTSGVWALARVDAQAEFQDKVKRLVADVTLSGAGVRAAHRVMEEARELGECSVRNEVDRLLADLRSTDLTPDAFLEALTRLVAGTLPQPARQEAVTP